MTARRVVVTGLGALTPLGNSVDALWSALVNGKSGISLIESFDTESFSVKICGAVKGLDSSEYLNPKEARKLDPFIQYGLIAAIQAVQDAGIADLSDEEKLNVGVAIGSGIGGIGTIEASCNILASSGPRKVSPFFVPGAVINMVSGNLAMRYGFKGPNIAMATACTTGTHSIGYGARTIAYGDADVMLAGGSEVATTPVGIAAFASARALSRRNDDPEGASRPWDRGRDGFVLGDGAGVVVLEEYEHARKRGANIYGELVGFGMSDDAFHVTAPPENGEGARLSMARAIQDANIALEDIHYINAHGTSTPAGDIAECNAIKRLLGSELAATVNVSSTKSMTGHLIGAAGAVEAIASLLAMKHNVVPPTLNLEDPDEGCDLNFTPNVAQERQVDVALSNSFGFGGTNGTLIFRRI
ncbi:3-oxoacyl-ACP synthase [Oleiphilus messinensis]|uniref:3-oxoacyl-[acyl-carrier-protein] synthase 2 n=1 Tax=Oleiphilus messinensis TaxID=141451 RepID=A0A1Y0IA75_9GAMM|nr:beta-ketoacyl-ACP synthase II [Oleiphilus messinensis]ARU56293.1 3-oxoacyl-ACP synthase [Oleiphilus messinensis]